MIINDRQDLDLAPDDVRQRFMDRLSAGINNYKWIDGGWVLIQDTETIKRYNFTLKDFPEAPIPKVPDYNLDEKNILQQKEDSRKALQQQRDQSLQSITHKLSDGAVVQVRPQDLTNFQLAMQLGNPEEWVMEDNTIRTLTVAEMQECVNSGIAQGKAIWDEYKAGLTEL